EPHPRGARPDHRWPGGQDTCRQRGALTMSERKQLLTARYGTADSHKLAVAERLGAYEVAKRAFSSMSQAQIKEEVKKANLRGRGGAGFPAGVKWGFLAPKPNEKVYLVINA